MSDIAEKEIYRKHAPSTLRTLFIAGLIVLAFCLGGIAYGKTVLDVPPELGVAAQAQFKFAMGLFLGLQFSLLPLIALCLHYISRLFRAKRLAEEGVLS